MKSPRTWAALFGRSDSSTTRAVGFTDPSELRGGSGSGARIRSGVGVRMSSLRLLALGVLVAGALLAIPSSAFAVPSSFGTRGEGAGQSLNPQGIAIEQETGDVYITDFRNERVDRFSSEGVFQLAFGWGVRNGAAEPQTCGPQAIPPIATCQAGIAGEGSGQFNGLTGIAIDNSGTASQGDVYVLDAGNRRVEKFSADGAFDLMFGGEVDKAGGDVCLAGGECQAGTSGSGPGEFLGFETGNPIATGPSGLIYVDDAERVQRFASSGVLESEITLPATGFARALTVDSTGDLYLIATGIAGIHKYDSTGAELGLPRDEPGGPELGGPRGLAIGSSDELIVDDESFVEPRHHLFVYDSAGTQISSFDAGPDSSGSQGLAFGDANEALYLLNYPESGATVRTTAIPPPGPLLLAGSGSATQIAPTSATLGATINPEGAETEYHFEYGTSTAYGESTPTALLGVVDEVQTLTLKATSGSYRLEFKGQSTTEIPLAAEASEVQAALETIPTIGAGNVSVTGSSPGPYAIEFQGALGDSQQPPLVVESANLKEATFVEGEERIRPGSASVVTSRAGAGPFTDRPVSAPITGLQPRTTYHYRVVAESPLGTLEGPDQEFTTLPPVSIISTSASGVSATAATLETELNPHGLLTTYRFEYGTTTAYDTQAPVPDASAGSGTAAVPRSIQIQGLAPSTTYHYRVVATNTLGTVEGPDRTFTTQAAAASLLPDGRVWELVSPPDKHGTPLESISAEGGVIQAAADGSGIAYFAKGPIDSEPAGNGSGYFDSQFLSRRGPAGWSTQDLTPPQNVHGVQPGNPSTYKFFSTDLSDAAVEPLGSAPLSPQTKERTPYLRTSSGQYLPLVNAANVPPGTEFGGTEASPESFVGGVQFVAATPDLAHILLQSPRPLTEDAAPAGEPQQFEWSAGTLQLVSQVPAGVTESSCGGTAGPCVPLTGGQFGNAGSVLRNAISRDGSRVVFGLSNRSLFLRDLLRRESLRLDLDQGGSGGGADTPVFQTASADDSRVFFTDTQRLTADSTAASAKPDLYMCQVVVDGAGHLACDLTDLTANHIDPAEPANVLGAVIGAAEDGSSVYFVADGALTTGEGAVSGNCTNTTNIEVARTQACNLYHYDAATQTLHLVAVLSGADAPDWRAVGGTDLGEVTSRVSPDGRYLAFMSQRSLTGYDNRDAMSGEPDEEVYLYDSQAPAGAQPLQCASCNPSGARPHGLFVQNAFPGPLVDRPAANTGTWGGQTVAANVPGWTRVDLPHALYQSRYLSNSGRLFFNAADALVPQDSNGVMDVYEYEPPGVGDCTVSLSTYSPRSGGCVGLISSGTSPEESAFLDASESGDDVFFLTGSRLAPGTDVDGALDVYDAAVGGSTHEAAKPVECSGDACQQPAVPPDDPTPGSLTFNGAGNLLQCPKGKVKKNGRCVKKKQAKKKNGKHKKSKKQAAKTKSKGPKDKGGR